MIKVKTNPTLAKLINLNKDNPEICQLWVYFMEISSIPRPSGKEGKIIKYIQKFAETNGFAFETDKMGNTLIEIPSSKGYKTKPGIIFQGHLDMVCVGNPDPAIHGVKPNIDKTGKWIEATKTTLGADNGIGVATMMAISKIKIPHGPIALLSTVSEEIGLKGAMALSFKNNLKKYRYLINLDSGQREKTSATIGCAGGGDTLISFSFKKKNIGKKIPLIIRVDKAMGGHSGIEIDKNYLQGIKILAETLSEIKNLNLISLRGGVAKNVIPKSAEAIIAINSNQIERIRKLVNKKQKSVREKTKYKEEKKIEITIAKLRKKIKETANEQDSKKIIQLLLKLPHGVIKWSQAVKGLVQTSTNLALVKTEDKEVKIEMMSRSSINEDLKRIRNKIALIAKEFSAKVEQKNPYPGWPPQPQSSIVTLTKKAALNSMKKKIELEAVHAGLECGVILAKYPHLEVISIGPTIENEHKEGERLNIQSVNLFYRFTKEIITTISS